MTTELSTDYTVIEREAGSFMSDHALKHKPHGLPPGVNFVTQDVLGYWEAEDGSGVELSTGTLLFGRIIGVTFPMVDGMADDRSGPAWSWQEVRVMLGYGDGEPE
jgi:hypothetical protein